MNKYFLKLNKKLGQAISTLTKVEKLSFDELVTNHETGRFIVVHFGLGTEEDYIGIKQFLLELGLNESHFLLDLYPGYPHGFLSLGSKEIAERLNSYIHDYNENELQMLKEKKELKNSMKEEPKDPKEEKSNPHLEKLLSRKFLMRSISLPFEDRLRNCFFFNTTLQAVDMKGFSSQNGSLQIATTDYDSLLKHGLIVIKDIITKEEETRLLDEIYKHEWENVSNRRIQHYGYKFIYGANSIDRHKKIELLPETFKKVLDKPQFDDLYNSIKLSDAKADDKELIATDEKIKEVEPEKITITDTSHDGIGIKISNASQPVAFNEYFDQLTIDEFKPGSGIPPHTDSHSLFEEPILSISLLSDIVILFKNPITNEETNVLIPARSAFILTGESRYLWTHSIVEKKFDRIDEGLRFRRKHISLVYRKTRSVSYCDCAYKSHCDYVLDKKSAKIKEEIDISKPEFEKKYVKDVYNSIAEHFSHTRYKAWPKVREFLKSLPAGSIVADIGCGNGKYMFCVDHLQFIGSDIASNFAKICKSKNPNIQVLVSDILNIPFRTSSVDHAISIAVIHHMSTTERRKAAIKELIRIVRPGGRVLIYVWAYEQEDKRFVDQDVFVPWNNQLKFESKDPIKDVDRDLNEAKQTIIYKRFYHVFKKGELEELVNECQKEMEVEVEIKDSFYNHENWCVELIKKH